VVLDAVVDAVVDAVGAPEVTVGHTENDLL